VKSQRRIDKKKREDDGLLLRKPKSISLANKKKNREQGTKSEAQFLWPTKKTENKEQRTTTCC